MAEIIAPTVKGMVKRGAPFSGMLFAGLMITESGPKLIEYNVRFGDPETEVILARLTSDLLELLFACAKGALRGRVPEFSKDASLTVVMAAKGYPGNYVKSTYIGDLSAAAAVPGVNILHAGTKLHNGELLSNGGRVLAITAVGDSISDARSRAYAAVRTIHWPQGFYRSDIGEFSASLEKGI